MYSRGERRKNIIMQMSNFRTYAQAEVKIPRHSTTLINGPSGVGKTTLMDAFLFAFYNGVSHPERFNTTRCWVWIFIGDIIVYRQKSPSLFKVWISDGIDPVGMAAPKVIEGAGEIEKDSSGGIEIGDDQPVPYGKEYTGDDALSIIESRFGSQNVFLACSYLRQKEFSLFLSGTDAEKLKLIKEISTKGYETDELKGPIKERLKQYEANTYTTRGQLDMAIKNIQQFDNSYPGLQKQQEEASKDNLTPEEVVSRVKELRNQSNMLDGQYRVVLQNETNLKAQQDQLAKYKTNYERDKDILNDLRTVDHATELLTIENAIQQHLSSVANSNNSSNKNDALLLLKHQAQTYKNWESHHNNLLESKSKNSDVLKSCLGGDITEEVLKLKKEDLIKRIEEIKLRDGKKQHFDLMLVNSGYKSIDDAKINLVKLTKDLNEKKSKLKDVSTVIEEYRLNKKWDCPECQTTLIFSPDGSALQKSAVQTPKTTPSPTPSPVQDSNPDMTPSITTFTAENPPTPVAVTTEAKPIFFAKNVKGPKMMPGIPKPVITTPIVQAPTPLPASTQSTQHVTHEKCKYEQKDLLQLNTEVAKLDHDLVRLNNVISSLVEAFSLLDVDSVKDTTTKTVSELEKERIELSSRWMTYHTLLEDIQKSEETAPPKVEEPKEEDTTDDEAKLVKIAKDALKDLKTKMAAIKSAIQNVDRYTVMIEQYELYIGQFNESITAFEVALNGKSAEGILGDMKGIQSEIDRLMHFNSTNDLITQRYILDKTMQEKTVAATNAETECAACKRLLEKTVEAERISLESSIDELNRYLAEYLNRLFTHAPITVEIKTTRTLKNKKISQRFDLQIFYGESSYDSVRQLSGGEKDRLSLAMTMAMNKKYGGTLLFLDETLSSLDSELKGAVVGLLKDFSSANRTVITVSHEETEGLYDQVIRIAGKD
tara:strand:- start:25640 stop:28453 length:2814 start_codon:yes stop_codon:yes gene_type:complete